MGLAACSEVMNVEEIASQYSSADPAILVTLPTNVTTFATWCRVTILSDTDASSHMFLFVLQLADKNPQVGMTHIDALVPAAVETCHSNQFLINNF